MIYISVTHLVMEEEGRKLTQMIMAIGRMLVNIVLFSFYLEDNEKWESLHPNRASSCEHEYRQLCATSIK